MADFCVFEEDEVSIFDGKTLKCGLVLESSEFASSDEEEEYSCLPKLKKGSIRVAWHPDGAEEELDESQVTVLTLQHEEVLRSFETANGR